MKNISSIILLILSFNLYPQNNDNAVNLLDKVSSKIDTANNYKIEFSYHVDDNINQKEKGNIIIENNNYFPSFFCVCLHICFTRFLLVTRNSYQSTYHQHHGGNIKRRSENNWEQQV